MTATTRWLWRLLPILLLAPVMATAGVAFTRPPTDTGALITSSWVNPEGSDADMYAYDSFVLDASAAITEVRWRGGNSYGALYGAVWNFSLTFYDSIAGGSQPHVNNPQLPEFYLARYFVGGTAGQTAVGTFGGTVMYDYHYVLPTPFQATAGVKYWLRIEASQIGYPDWGIATGTGAGADGKYFRFSTGAAMFQAPPGDIAFTLMTSDTPTFTVAASASPAGTGSITGTGAFPDGTRAVLTATPAPGYGFLNWTVNGLQVSTSATYGFTVHADRTLVANFVPTYTMTTAVYPRGGSTTGDGSYNSGAPVTVVATPNPGYLFVDWTENGMAVSTAATYQFTASANRALVATFALAANAALFDFDTGMPTLNWGHGTPLEQTTGGILAQFSSPTLGAQGFSTQSAGTTFFHLSQFAGLYLYPNSVFNPQLEIHFSEPLTSISFTYATADFQQVEIPSTVRVTAYVDATGTAAVGSASSHGTYAGDTMPMGTLTFNSGAPFNVVLIEITWSPQGASDLLVDNIVVQKHPGTGCVISTNASPEVGGSTGGAGMYANGAPVTLSAIPSPGWTFVNWTQDGTVVSAAASYSFNATASRALVASFAPACTITTEASPASGGTTSGDGTYSNGTHVTVQATPNNGFTFVYWTENGTPVSANASYDVVADTDHYLVAVFAGSFTIDLRAAPDLGGSATGGGTYAGGTGVSVVATANPGYAFVNWTEDGVPVSNWAGYGFTASANRTLIANFASACTMTAGLSPANSGTTRGDGVYPSGATATVTASPATGYAFVSWTENGTPVSTSPSYSFTAAADRTLLATFTSSAQGITFDLDSGTPALAVGQPTPLAQTIGSLTAQFSSPADPAFTIQSDVSLGWTLPGFAGNYLHPQLGDSPLEIHFSQLLTGVTLAFATYDFQELVTPTPLQLNAYLDTTTNAALGTTTAQGTLQAGNSLPMGLLVFTSSTPFNVIRIDIPHVPQGATEFLVDTVAVTTCAGTPTVFTLSLSPGWNLIALPCEPLTPRLDQLFATPGGTGLLTTGPACFWNTATATYEATMELHAGTGYWLFATSAATVDIPGVTVLPELALAAGWNLAGPVSQGTPAANPLPLLTSPANAVTGPVWHWTHGGYQAETHALQPGSAYWLHATTACRVLLAP